MDYTILAAELARPEYAGLDDAAAAAALNAPAIAVPSPRFVSLRGLAAVLDDAEYGAFKQFLAAAAAHSPRVADMAAILALPCADDGATGGLDFGSAGVRAMLDQFAAADAAAAAKLRALGEQQISRAVQLRLPPVSADAVGLARGTRPFVQR